MQNPPQMGFLALLESLLSYVQRQGARRTLPELRLLSVLAKGESNTLAIADDLRTEPRIVKDWLDMAADDGLILECGWIKVAAGQSGKAKVWKIAPDGVALLRGALDAVQACRPAAP